MEKFRKDSTIFSSPRVKYIQKEPADFPKQNNSILGGLSKNKEAAAGGQSLIINRIQKESAKIEVPAAKIEKPRVPSDKDSDMSSLRLSRPLNSEPSSTKLPSAHTLNSSISGLSSFSILQSNYNNINNFLINPVINQNESEQVNTLSTNRSKTDDLSSTIKAHPNDFAKQLSGLQAIISKNNNILQSSLLNGLSNESLKPVKNISSPIVLRHNPQVLLANEAAKRIEALKSQGKSEFKVTHRLNRSDDEELAVQKKLKTDNVNNILNSVGN